jgi:predicted dehydrogenase
VGDVLYSTYIGAGLVWGDAVSLGEAYAMDSRNGATLLSIIGGHALAAVHEVIGHTREVAMHLSRRRRSVRVTDTGEMIPMKTHDYVLVNAVLDSGAPLMKQLRGGLPRGTRLLWEINGTEADNHREERARSCDQYLTIAARGRTEGRGGLF